MPEKRLGYVIFGRINHFCCLLIVASQLDNNPATESQPQMHIAYAGNKIQYLQVCVQARRHLTPHGTVLSFLCAVKSRYLCMRVLSSISQPRLEPHRILHNLESIVSILTKHFSTIVADLRKTETTFLEYQHIWESERVCIGLNIPLDT